MTNMEPPPFEVCLLEKNVEYLSGRDYRSWRSGDS